MKLHLRLGGSFCNITKEGDKGRFSHRVCWVVLVCFLTENLVPFQNSSHHSLSPPSQVANSVSLSASPYTILAEGIPFTIVVLPVEQLAFIAEYRFTDRSTILHQRRKHFEFLKVLDPDGTIRICVAPISPTLIDRDSVWSQRKEIHQYLFAELTKGTAVEISTERKEQIILEMVTKLNQVQMGEGSTPEDVLKEFFVNSQSAFERIASSMMKGETSYPLEKYSVRSADYSHLQHFSWIYAIQTQFLKKILAQDVQKGISVLDVGTGFGHLILTSYNLLDPQERKQTHYVGTK